MTPPSLLAAARRVFDLSFGEMLWSRRTIFMALVVGGPVILALVFRIVESLGMPALRVNGARVAGSSIFGVMMWMLYIRFIVPVLGVFYGTALMADEVEDKTLTYLFTRPIPRGAVLLGKYLAYLVCTSLVVLPSVMLTYFLVVPFAEVGGHVPVAGARPGHPGARPGRLRRGLRLRRHLAEAAAGRRAGLRLRLGAGGDGAARLPARSSPWRTTSRPWSRTPCRATTPSASCRASSGRPRRQARRWRALLAILAVFLWLAMRMVARREYVLEQ